MRRGQFSVITASSRSASYLPGGYIMTYVRLAVLWLALGVSTGEQVIKTPLGSLRGATRTSRDGREYTAWTRVPFAKPPIGKLRFAEPQPAEKWEGVLEATKQPPKCSQLAEFRNVYEGQEDCLYVNIYKPKIDAKNLPVLFHVHGGAFKLGHPGQPEMADYIMDEDVILVSTTYRLGALGFMSLGDDVLPGNNGLKDQALALRWTKDNIAAFGGNPESITVFGESAGGASTHFLTLSPLTKNMVTRAMLISGTVNKAWTIATGDTKPNSKKLLERLNCIRATSEESVACMRELDASAIMENGAMLENRVTQGSIPFGPTVEPAGPGAFMVEDLTQAASTTPLIISYAAGEYILFELPLKLQGGGQAKNAARDLDGYARGVLKGHFKDEEKIKAAATKLKERYLKHDKTQMAEVIHDMAMIFQDMAFVHPALEVAENHKGPKWVYQLVHRGELSLFDFMLKLNTTVACHADEMLILFNRRSVYKNAKEVPEPTDTRVSKEMVKYLANFATYGNPTPEGSPMIWKPYQGNEILRIKSEGSEMGSPEFIKEQKDILQFWNGLREEAAASTKEEL